jgi:hypothetical protein
VSAHSSKHYGRPDVIGASINVLLYCSVGGGGPSPISSADGAGDTGVTIMGGDGRIYTTSEFAERKLRLSPVRANPTAFVHKLRTLPNDRAILRKDEGINEQAIKFQPDGLFDSSFVVRVTVTTQ